MTLFVYYLWLRPSAAEEASATWDAWLVVGASAGMLAGVSAAVLRRPAAEVAVPFTLLVVWSLLLCLGNSGLTLFGVSEVVAPRILGPLQAIMVSLTVLAAESIRSGWRWRTSKATAETGNPVPWVAVGAIAIFVLKIGVEQVDTGVGIVVIGGVLTMLLLVARQALTMRHNEELQAERAALLTESKIAALVRHTSDVIMIADEGLKVRYASPSAESLWGRPASDLLGIPVAELVESSNRPAIERLLAQRLAQPGQTDSTRWRVPGKDGSIRRVEAVVISLLHEPSVQGVVITLRDQTDRIHLEEQLNQSQKMEAVGQLAGGVAHDFNNLLTTILGHTEVGLDMLDDAHPVREDLTQIKRASELAASLTRQLLAFSRKQVIEPRVVDVAVSLEQVVRLLRRLIKEHVTTVLEVGADLGRIRVDPSHLEQVVLNLAVNARDAMPQGGTLSIRARAETITAQIPDAVVPVPITDCIVVEVIDTGTGMDAATQARIFEPFFTTKPPGRGTGLGLASVYGIVKQSGAGMVVRSAPGKGSSFAVYFPKVAALLEVVPATVPAQAQSRFAATILLCEDETALREIAHKVLAREGYRVLVASEAEEALTLAASAPFPIDLLLSDVVMPGMSGPVLAQKLKAVRPNLRILLMSGYPGDDLTGELKPDQRFLRKPFTPFVLLEHVRAAVAGLGDPAPSDTDSR